MIIHKQADQGYQYILVTNTVAPDNLSLFLSVSPVMELLLATTISRGWRGGHSNEQFSLTIKNLSDNHS